MSAMPYSEDAEIMVLGAAMKSADFMFDVLEMTQKEDFYKAAHQKIYEAISEIKSKGMNADLTTVQLMLEKSGNLALVGGASYIESMISKVVSPTNAKGYIKIVQEKAALRSLIISSDKIGKMATEQQMDVGDILETAEAEILEIGSSRHKDGLQHIGDTLNVCLEAIRDKKATKGDIGLKTGFIDLDTKLGTIEASDLVILAARPAMGKTSFAINIALNVAKRKREAFSDAKNEDERKENNKGIIIFSLEMSKKQLADRMLSIEGRVPAGKIKEADLGTEDFEKLADAIDILSPTNIYIDDSSGHRLNELKNKCRQVKNKQGLELIIVDYLQLMDLGGRQESRQIEISKLSRNFKLLAKEMDCPIIVLSQLSRAVESRKGNKPQLSDLRESGAIEQDADIVMFLYREEVYDPETERQGICDVIISKHRHGEIGEVELNWNGAYTSFHNRERESDF